MRKKSHVHYAPSPFRGNVRSLGCHTNGWQQYVQLDDKVLRSLVKEPALQDWIDRAMKKHARKMPPMLQRGGELVTLVDDGRFFPDSTFLVTLCDRQGRLRTILGFASSDLD